MRNKDYPFFTGLFVIAALWNLVGAGFGYFNTEYTFLGLFERELNDPLVYEIYKGAWGTTLMFFIGYLMVAYNPVKHSGVALIGGIGKLGFAITELQLYLGGLANSKILIIVLGDFIFCVLFVYYFVKLYSDKKAFRINPTMLKTMAVLLLVSVGIPTVQAQETWELAKDKKGIKVYVSEIPNSDYYAFKAIMSVKASETEIVKMLKEVDTYPEWFAFTASAKLIKQTTNEQLFFMETDFPWPYSNECMNYQMEFVENQDNIQKITITESNKNTNCKRSLKKASGYILLEPDGENTKISYYFHSEPSQNIPTWLINPMIHEMPYQTFVSMRKKLNSLNKSQP